MNLIQWANDWNNIIRDLIYPDETLRELMLIPTGSTIIDFRDKYFIKAGYSSDLVTEQKVRIVYADMQGNPGVTPNTTQSLMTFDIFVKKDSLHNATNDRLMMRTELIAQRLLELFTKERYVKETGYRFWIGGAWDLGTRTTGYARYCLALNYVKVY